MSVNSINHLYGNKFIIVILLLWSRPVFAQQHSADIKVIDAENGSGIESATVQWKVPMDPAYKSGTATNRNGVASLSLPPACPKVVLRVSCVGYHTVTDTITVSGKHRTIRLWPESTELESVMVFGKTKA